MIDAVKVVVIPERLIKTQFVKNPDADKYSGSHAKRQPADINERITSIT